MLTAEYFRATFEHDVKAAGTAMRAEMHLLSGVVFEIARVESAEKGYAVLRVYPPEETDASAVRQRRVPDAPAPSSDSLDSLIVAYESIACVHFRPADRHPERAVGF